MIRAEISIVAALLCVFGLWIAGVFAISLIRARRWRAQQQRSAALLPQIRETLVDYMAGSDKQQLLRQFAIRSREDVSDTILSFQGTVAGSARDRLCELALDLALVHEWCEESRSRNVLVRRKAFARLAFVSIYEPCRRLSGDLLRLALKDRDDEVKLYASRALTHSANLAEIGRVFEHAVGSDLLVRTLLTSDLQRHAVDLCRTAIPKELESGDPVRIQNVLHMAIAWERAVPMPGMARLLASPERQVRMQALRLTPHVLDSPEVRKGILDALVDPDTEIVSCAAQAAARCNLEAALPALARCLRVGSEPVARAAAEALSAMPKGVETLRELCASSTELTALLAQEALARVPQ